MHTFLLPKTPYRVTVLNSIFDLPEHQRVEIFAAASTPFNQFAFLAALEESNSIGDQSGWLPKYHLVFQEQTLVGLFIGFEKHHSYGEYVFDWAWAQAYHQHGLEYYPKLLFAIPFTPVPCDKWLSASGISEQQMFEWLCDYYQYTGQYSGVHLNFPVAPPTDSAEHRAMVRHGCQFHWNNKKAISLHEDTGFSQFEEYLSLMTARKRKAVKRERQKIKAAGIQCQWLNGSEIGAHEISQFYRYYQLTYAKRGQQGYLTQAFFNNLVRKMPDKVRLLVCRVEMKIVATAWYFVDETTLYGRYWGSNDQFDLLHFEACYYQGIDYCIQHQLAVFNPGTQGEHKISRGFVPTTTYSYHQIFVEPFEQAIRRFCQDEQQYNAVYMEECERKLPFKLPQ